MIEWTVGLMTGTEPQSGCTIDGNLTGNVLRCSSGFFLKSHPACFLLREQREDDDGNKPNHVCSFPKAHRSFQRCRPLCSDKATMRLRLRDNNRGRYTNTHVVLHVNSGPDEREEKNL
jgi:hypothetical protein